MSDRFSHTEMADILLGDANSLEDFITSHSLKTRPQSWFDDNNRRLIARRQAADDYRAAAARQKGTAA